MEPSEMEILFVLLGMMMQKTGFFGVQLSKRHLNFGAYTIDNFSCCLKFKCWRETTT